jgi:hypothetical protein
MIAEKAVAFTPEMEFVRELGLYLGQDISDRGQKRIISMLGNYRKKTQTVVYRDKTITLPAKTKVIYRGSGRNISSIPERFYHPSEMISIVCGVFGVSVEQIETRTRKPGIVFARYVCMFFLRRYTMFSLGEIAAMLGDAVSNHTTVIHGLENVSDKMDAYPEIREQIEYIDQLIRNNLMKIEKENH